MIKFTLSPALLSATGWFVGLLVVMIIVTALFAMVLVIALKPIKKFETDENDMSKKLERRETELTIKLLKNSNDPKRTELLLKELREVTAAEKLVNRIIEEENAVEKAAAQKAVKPQQPTQRKANQPRPAQAQQPAPARRQVNPEQVAPTQSRPAAGQPRSAQPAPARRQVNPEQAAPAQPRPVAGQQKPAKPASARRQVNPEQAVPAQPRPAAGQQKPAQPAPPRRPEQSERQPVQQKQNASQTVQEKTDAGVEKK